MNEATKLLRKLKYYPTIRCDEKQFSAKWPENPYVNLPEKVYRLEEDGSFTVNGEVIAQATDNYFWRLYMLYDIVRSAGAMQMNIGCVECLHKRKYVPIGKAIDGIAVSTDKQKENSLDILITEALQNGFNAELTKVAEETGLDVGYRAVCGLLGQKV
jgi:hypothetical protein